MGVLGLVFIRYKFFALFISDKAPGETDYLFRYSWDDNSYLSASGYGGN